MTLAVIFVPLYLALGRIDEALLSMLVIPAAFLLLRGRALR